MDMIEQERMQRQPFAHRRRGQELTQIVRGRERCESAIHFGCCQCGRMVSNARLGLDCLAQGVDGTIWAMRCRICTEMIFVLG